jgi:hypothetical protein
VLGGLLMGIHDCHETGVGLMGDRAAPKPRKFRLGHGGMGLWIRVGQGVRVGAAVRKATGVVPGHCGAWARSSHGAMANSYQCVEGKIVELGMEWEKHHSPSPNRPWMNVKPGSVLGRTYP